MVTLNMSPLVLTVSLPCLLLQLSRAQNLQLGQWQQVQYAATTPIAGRYFHAGAFLSSTNEYLVFGGFIEDHLSDFHSIDMSSLRSTQLSAITPLGRRNGMAYTSDLASNLYVLGGFNGNWYTNDFWRFNVQTRNWTRLSNGPSERMNHCLEWDQGRNQLIMFGGYTISSNFNDLWTYSIESAQWQQVTPAGTSLPGGRSYHACAFDTQSSTFHVQGGQQRQSQPQTYQDLWRFDFTASDWALINSGNSNVRKFRHSMQYSKSLNSLLLFGGYDDFSQIPTKTIHQFSFNNQLAGWTLFQDSGSQMPSQRTSFSAGFNPLTGEYIVFGGSSGFEFLSTSRSSSSIIAIAKSPEISSPLISNTALSISSRLVILNTTVTGVVIVSDERQITSQAPSLIFPTLKTTKSTSLKTSNAQPLTQSDFSISIFIQTNLLYVIAGGSLFIVLTISLCIWRCKRSRKRRAHTSESIAADKEASSMTKSSKNNDTSNTLTEMSTSMSSQYSQTTTTITSSYTGTSTAVATELGLSVPGYLQIDFAKSVRVKSVLAEGGFGTVALADALSPMLKRYGDQVIVKQVKKSKISDRTIQLFNQEMALMEYFKGEQYIAKLLGYSTDPFCLVMKYYPMGSLSRVIRVTRNRCKIHVIAFTRNIAYGLSAMHAKGIVHNDLKSDNVLVDTLPETGRPYCVLSDLGISQIVTQQILKVGEFKVTEIRALSMAYAAPERIYSFRNKINISGIDQQTIFSWDVYALGLILFELLTGTSDLY